MSEGGIVWSPEAIEELREALGIGVARAASERIERFTPSSKHPIPIRTGRAVSTAFSYQHEIDLGKMSFDDSSVSDTAPTFASYNRPDPVVACGLERWLLEEEEEVVLHLRNGLWWIVEGRRLWRYVLRENSKAPEPTSAHIQDMGGVTLSTPREVEDPLEMFMDQRTGAPGYCYLQGGKFWMIQAPCP
jgi:hypothetical protein